MHIIQRINKGFLKSIYWKYKSKVSHNQHIFIVGAPRSGTTLIQNIMANHPEISAVDAENAFFDYHNIFQRKYAELNMKEKNIMLSKAKDLVAFFDQYAEYIKNKKGGKYFLEKTPQNVNKLDYILKHFPSSKIINVYRDGRDCYRSARKHPNIPQAKSCSKYAKYWKKCIQNRVKNDVTNIIDIHYESFVSTPEEYLKDITNHLEIKYMDTLLSPSLYSKSEKATHAHFSKLNETINTKSIGKWKDELTESEKETFIKIAGKELKKLNYI